MVPLAQFEYFPFVPALAVYSFFAGFPDFTGVLAFTIEFVSVAVYALKGALDFTGVVAFPGELPLAELFFIPFDSACAGYAFFGKKGPSFELRLSSGQPFSALASQQ